MQKLILISGEAWTGKTTFAELLLSHLDNAAWLDGDDVWRVNPWDVHDKRIRNSDLNMAYVIANYLRSAYDYVILSSIVLTVDDIRDRIIGLIEYDQCEIVHFTLLCDKEILIERAKKRDDNLAPSFVFHDMSRKIQDSIKINTGGRSREAVIIEMMRFIEK